MDVHPTKNGINIGIDPYPNRNSRMFLKISHHGWSNSIQCLKFSKGVHHYITIHNHSWSSTLVSLLFTAIFIQLSLVHSSLSQAKGALLSRLFAQLPTVSACGSDRQGIPSPGEPSENSWKLHGKWYRMEQHGTASCNSPTNNRKWSELIWNNPYFTLEIHSPGQFQEFQVFCVILQRDITKRGHSQAWWIWTSWLRLLGVCVWYLRGVLRKIVGVWVCVLRRTGIFQRFRGRFPPRPSIDFVPQKNWMFDVNIHRWVNTENPRIFAGFWISRIKNLRNCPAGSIRPGNGLNSRASIPKSHDHRILHCFKDQNGCER